MRNSLLFVTDLGQFKAFKVEQNPGETPRLELVEEGRVEEAHQRVGEGVTDRAGERAAPTNRSWGSPVTDAHNLELENKRRLIRRIAERIERLASRDPGLNWMLAADKEIHAPLLEKLPAPVRARLLRSLACDLTKAGSKELIERFCHSEEEAEKLS